MDEKKITETLTSLLQIDLQHNAKRLEYIDKVTLVIDEDLVYAAIDVLNFLSYKEDDLSKKQFIAVAALLWYYNDNWTGVDNYLVLFLARIGFGPSSLMADKGYNFEDNTFSTTESLINQLAIYGNLIQYEINLQQKIILLTEYQYNIWNKIEQHSLLGISAPTSAGKSFIILLKAIDLLFKKDGQVIYVVPTLSLVSQVVKDFRNRLNEFGLFDYEVDTSYNVNRKEGKRIYVLTQEKAISAFSQDEVPFVDVRLLVIDEIQNIERVADWTDQRAKILFDLIVEIRNSLKIDHTIISGPRIDQIDQLGNDLFEIDAIKSETKSSPVMSITYSISKRKEKGKFSYYFKLYSDLLESPLEIKIPKEKEVIGYGGSMYKENFLSYLTDFVTKVGIDHKNLIFAPTGPISREIAEELIKKRQEQSDDFLVGLSTYLQNSVHPKFSLANTVKFGVAYHNGKLPNHARIVIEDAIKKQKINDVACTTTLLQGVNLPVQNIILRNPNLFVKSGADGSKPRLSNYEIANLRGRAGRLLKDFIGRTYALDESSFIESNETDKTNLSADESKSIKVGYGEKFNEFQGKIRIDLKTQDGHTADNKEYSYLTTYIRQTIYRHEANSGDHLKRVGINLSESEINDVLTELKKLNLSKAICASNRYWDPYDLAIIRNEAHLINAPVDAFEQNLAAKIETILKFYKNRLPLYYNHYFGVEEVPGKEILRSKSITIERWLRETSLYDILNDPYYDTAEKIEDAITFLQNKVSFGLPTMLKPLYEFKQSDQMFTRFIEMGAYSPVVRRLIELNIPRETAIMLSENYSFNLADDTSILRQLRSISLDLPNWYKVQLEGI